MRQTQRGRADRKRGRNTIELAPDWKTDQLGTRHLKGVFSGEAFLIAVEFSQKSASSE